MTESVVDESCVPAEEKFECLRHAYTEAAASFRHYSALRFAILSVYIALVGALGGVALGIVGGTVSNSRVSRIAAFAALLVTWAFLTCEIVCERNRHYFSAVLKDLEVLLPCKAMTHFPISSLFRASRVFKILYTFNLLLWGWVLLSGRL